MFVVHDVSESDKEGVIELLFYLWNVRKELLYVDSLIKNEQLLGCYLDNTHLVGIIVYRKIDDEIEICDIVTHPDHKRRGVATLLIKFLITKYSPQSMHVELRASNTEAFQLYDKSQFKYVGKRAHYYDNPREDALLLRYDKLTEESINSKEVKRKFDK